MEQTLQIGIFGDSISKGIVLDAETHRYSSLKKEITEWISPSTALHNFSVMGSTIQKGLSIITRHTDQLASYQNVFLEFGGNDCDFDWQAVSDHPEEAHLPKIAAETFAENYRALVKLLRQAGSSFWMTSLVPLEAHRFLNHVSQGRSKENILSWLGDADRIFRWQEYYNDLVCRLARELSCPLLELRPEFLKDPAFPTLISNDGIHPTQKGHDLVHRCVEEVFS